MIKTRHDLLLDRLEPVLFSEAFKNAELSAQEAFDIFRMGIVFHRTMRRGLSLLESGDAIDHAAIERTDPSDEEAAELERIADWIIQKYQTNGDPEI